MTIRHPSTTEEVRTRNRLLQHSLRPENFPIDIVDEYPLVLNPKIHQYSYCQFIEERAIAHFNLYPKDVVDASNRTFLTVGLVGNVATDADSRGQGLMRTMFRYLDSTAGSMSLDALVLWSDLTQFYQKLGFESLASELLLSLSASSIQARVDKASIHCPPIHCLTPGELSDQLAVELMKLRPNWGLHLKRRPDEFRDLLTIPDCYLILVGETSHPLAYLILGKGYDMVKVIHEWGFEHIDPMLCGIQYLFERLSIEALFLLSPAWHKDKKVNEVIAIAESSQEQPMCFYRPIAKNQKNLNCLQKLFVWGLDSI